MMTIGHGQIPEPITIDDRRALALLAEVINLVGPDHRHSDTRPARPGHVRPRAYWDTDHDCPACIVGWALSIAGIPAPVLIDADTCNILLLEIDNVSISTDARNILRAAQKCQDVGNTWDMAVAAGRDTYHQRRSVYARMHLNVENVARQCWHEQQAAGSGQDVYLKV